ncbi:hypothetical protein [Phytoactinopolyspora endophytica]|uniref:hypothetical protein n=1 Tax=Phytoactinopolyspora endophytica TaxID=1642495 RepID=UPI00101C5630|nr:hypothetical protein [Phytoactinopolyspora endophytica]
MTRRIRTGHDDRPLWHDTAPGTPRWAIRAAHVISLVTLPAALWRLGIIVGIPWGYDRAWIERSQLDTLDGAAYLLGLSVVSEIAALCSYALVQRWGEVMPPWAWPLRGWAIPAWLPAVCGVLGGVAMTAMWTVGTAVLAMSGTAFDSQMEPGAATTVQLLAYAPMVVWGPLLLALSFQYSRRRARTSQTLTAASTSD